MFSRIYPEWQTYLVFENLMKAIVGSYVLSGDYKDEYSGLPEDFVDLCSNTIVWHSDNGTDNILKFSYNERAITITVSKNRVKSPLKLMQYVLEHLGQIINIIIKNFWLFLDA